VQGGLVGPIVGSLGERRALMLALVSGAAGFTIYGLAATGRWFLAGIPVMAFWGLYGPSAQSLMTRRVDPSEQGRLQGALASVVGIANVISPIMFSRIFAASLSTSRGWQLPGAAFLLSALLLVIAGGIGWEATKDQPAADAQPKRRERLTAQEGH